MSIRYKDTVSREQSRSGGWVLVAIAIICIALVAFPEASRSTQSMLGRMIPIGDLMGS
jgi:hypothetical protein